MILGAGAQRQGIRPGIQQASPMMAARPPIQNRPPTMLGEPPPSQEQLGSLGIQGQGGPGQGSSLGIRSKEEAA